MALDPSGVEQAVSRTLRDNLDKLQRMSEELHQAIADLVSACASSRPTNALPPMLRSQTAAAALAATLDVLSRFITTALQPAQRPPAEEEVIRVVAMPSPKPSPAPVQPPPSTPIPMADSPWRVPAAAAQAVEIATQAAMPEAILAAPESAVGVAEPPAAPVAETRVEAARSAPAAEPRVAAFDLASLSVEEQEMHRRANRVAKVCMQDIKMLRPEQVQAGRAHKDICVRLRDDIEKAHREYDRRFRPIMDHPVDYFYSWLVEILAGGDPEALGEYPYPSPALRDQGSAATYARLSEFANSNSESELGPRAALALGYYDFSKRRLQQAQQWLEKAQRDSLLRECTLYWRAQTSRAQGRNADALAQLEAFRQEFPESAITDQAVQSLAETALALGKADREGGFG